MASAYRRLVKLIARAFYNEEIPSKGPNRTKSDKSDNRGIAVVILDALTRRQWVKEEDLAKTLGLHPKQLRRTLRVLEEELLVVREHRRETVKGAKAYNAAIAAVSDGVSEPPQEEKLKVHTHSYCCLDYAQIYDVVRYRIHRAKRKIKDELEDRNTIQEYICPSAGCGRRYSALDAPRLISPFDENFHCESCNAELVAESDKLAAVEISAADGEDNARRRRRESLKELLEKLETHLKPLLAQLARVKDVAPPEFRSLAEWESRAVAAGRLAANGDAVLQKVSHGQGLTSTPMLLGETKVEVALAGLEAKEEGTKEEAGGAVLKVLPPWMIRQGMSLTAQQRGEAKVEQKQEDGAELGGPTVETKEPEDDKEAVQKQLQEEYLKAYYAALLKRTQEAEAQSGMIEGPSASAAVPEQEVYTPGTGSEEPQGMDLNEVPSEVAAAPPETGTEVGEFEEEEEEDIDWEEG